MLLTVSCNIWAQRTEATMLAEIAVPWSNIGLRLQPDAGVRWSAVVSARHDAPLAGNLRRKSAERTECARAVLQMTLNLWFSDVLCCDV